MLYYDDFEKLGLTSKLCDHCKKYIIDEISGDNTWLCEGRYCDYAEESFITTDKNGIIFYRCKKIQELKNLT